MAALLPSLLLLFVLSSFFSASETVLFSLTPLQLQRIAARHPHSGARISRWLADPARILSTILAGNTLVNFAIASCGYMVMNAVLPNCAEAANAVVFTLLLLLFGEVVPKQWAMRNAELAAPTVATILVVWYVALWPVSRLMSLSTRVFHDLLRRERRALSDDELCAVMEGAAASGAIDAEEASMVAGVLRLSGLYASDEMTPRVDIVGVEESMDEAEQVRIAFQAPYPYLPIYRRTPDSITGFINVKKLSLDPAHNVAAATEPPFFVPENAGLDSLLEQFRASGRHIAVVLDEYGGTAGLITRGDVLELVSEPVTASESKPIKSVGGNAWVCSGTVSLEEINRELGLELSADDADRLSGWMLFYAGRFPRTGETVTAQGVAATVVARRNRRILQVRLQRLEAPDPAEDGVAAEAEAMDMDDGEETGESTR